MDGLFLFYHFGLAAQEGLVNETPKEKEKEGPLAKHLFRALMLFVAGYLVYNIFFIESYGPNGLLLLEGELSGEVSPAPLHPAPDFQLTDLRNDSVSLGKLRGKVVVLSFWAPWCAPCLKELPWLERMAHKSGEDIVVLAVATQYDSAETVAGLMKNRKTAAMHVLLDEDSRAGALFGVRTVPTTLIIDRSGIVRYRLEGVRHWDSKAALADLRKVADLP